MLRCKTLVILSLSLGGALLLLGLLAGFVPQSEGPEVRRRASAHVVSLRPEDLPEPFCRSATARTFGRCAGPPPLRTRRAGPGRTIPP